MKILKNILSMALAVACGFLAANLWRKFTTETHGATSWELKQKEAVALHEQGEHAQAAELYKALHAENPDSSAFLLLESEERIHHALGLDDPLPGLKQVYAMLESLKRPEAWHIRLKVSREINARIPDDQEWETRALDAADQVAEHYADDVATQILAAEFFAEKKAWEKCKQSIMRVRQKPDDLDDEWEKRLTLIENFLLAESGEGEKAFREASQVYESAPPGSPLRLRAGLIAAKISLLLQAEAYPKQVVQDLLIYWPDDIELKQLAALLGLVTPTGSEADQATEAPLQDDSHA